MKTDRSTLSAWLAAPDREARVPVPEVIPPSLDGLAVTLPVPADITQDELLARYQVLADAVAPRETLPAGTPLQPGDEAVIDVIGRFDTQVLPFSAHTSWPVTLRPEPPLPGFAEALVGLPVGRSSTVYVVIPRDYPAPALRLSIATFDVDVIRAARPRPLDADSPDLLPALGLGQTLQSTMDAVLQLLMRERAVSLRQEAMNLALDEVRGRAPVELPPALVDQEIWQRWAEAEGPALLRFEVDDVEIERAAEAWLGDPELRADAARRLHIGVVLAALARRDGLGDVRARRDALVSEAARSLGADPQEAHAAMLASPRLVLATLDSAAWLAAVERVMAHVELGFAA